MPKELWYAMSYLGIGQGEAIEKIEKIHMTEIIESCNACGWGGALEII